MGLHTSELWQLSRELLSDDEVAQLRSVLSALPSTYPDLVAFDRDLGGPGISNINYDGTGRYASADRDVFRPLQYCAVLLERACNAPDPGWFSRDIVKMSSLHVESLVKRIGGVPKLPLGQALHSKLVQRKIDSGSFKRIERFAQIYNDAKHNVSQPKDTHLFSMEDAVLAYVVSRRLGSTLYALANLTTGLDVFEQ